MTGSARELLQEEWIVRCLARMTMLDPVVSRDDLSVIVSDMADRARWRTIEPEAAADMLFGPITPSTKWPSTDSAPLQE